MNNNNFHIDVDRFWNNVSKTLVEEKMSWASVAREAGLSSQSLASARYLKTSLRIGTVIRLCSVLEKRPSELLIGLEKPIPSTQKKATTALVNLAWKCDARPAVMMLLPCLDATGQEEILKIAKQLKEKRI